MKKIFILIIVLVIGAAILVGLWRYKQGKMLPKTASPSGQKSDSVKITQVKGTDLPEKFPADFPIEAGAQITANYNSQNGSTFQATRQFVSKKTIAENSEIYQKYFAAKKWKVVAFSEDSHGKFFSAKSPSGQDVRVTINKNIYTSQVTVDISFVYKK